MKQHRSSPGRAHRERAHKSNAAALALAMCSVVPGCGPRSLGSFQAPEPAHDAGPDGGQDAALPPPAEPDASGPECSKTSHCDDQDPCNGVYACRAGECVQVEPACVESDDDACDTCVVLDAQRCVTVARDRDGDEHGSSACTRADQSGDDCDDLNATIHGEADELCDGLDNDCDGKIDLQDGLTASGELEVLGPGQLPAIVWSSERAVHGLAYEHQGIRFLTLDASGEPLLSEAREVYSDSAEPAGDPYRPAISFGHHMFAVTWARVPTPELSFRRVGLDGAMLSEIVSVSPDTAGVRRGHAQPVGENDWLVVYEGIPDVPGSPARVLLRRIDVNDVVQSPLEQLADLSSALVGVRPSGKRVGMLWTRFEESHEGSRLSVNFTVRDGDTTDEHPVRELASSDSMGASVLGPARLGASARGFTAIWQQTDEGPDAKLSLQYMELDREGQTLCGPIDLLPYFPAAPGRLFGVDDVVATERGYAFAVLYVPDVLKPDAAVDMVEMFEGCRYGQRFRVADTRGVPHTALSRATDGRTLVLYQRKAESGEFELHKRVLGPHFCD